MSDLRNTIVVTPMNGTYFENPQPTCPDCERLKVLLLDVWDYLQPQPDNHHYQGHYDLLEKRMKKEGII
ncbi:MAG: hypothetical protein Q7J98_13130 [Kiritimatiellia bacterium]|nr:hypothetical protein [Kiritimatiellia bacterium]